MAELKRLALERLMRYYRFLAEMTAKKPLQTVTSAQIAAALDIDATQVRKDLASIGLVGMGRVGFDVCEICRAINLVIGFDQQYAGVLVGVGHLGAALLSYTGFAAGFDRYGLHVVAAFDHNQRRIGSTIKGITIRPMKGMTALVRREAVRLAIITTPAEVAQRITDRLIPAGVKAIWNFAPTQLTVPDDVLVRNEHISIGLSEIAYHLKQ